LEAQQNTIVTCDWLGKIPYSESLRIQKSFINSVGSKEIKILGFECEPVITVGKRGSLARDLIATKEIVTSKGYDIVKVDRGGELTMHHPGQLVIYPLVPIEKLKISVKDFVDLLENLTVGCFKESLGIHLKRQASEPGLYTDNGKLVFLGLRIQKGVSTHGLSINVNNSLEDFSMIKPCGVAEQKMDRTTNYSPLETKSVFETWCQALKKEFIST
jgi:lipoyl(octanoyl) transferase